MSDLRSPDLARRTLARIRADPVLFAHSALAFQCWSKQREIIESVRDHHSTAVRSSHGVGKTAIAAIIVLWFLAAYGPRAMVVTTAPTWRQVRDLLWKEIAAGCARSRGFYAVPTGTRLEFAPKWYAVGVSTNQPENFQGYHSPHLLFVVDEASGVKQPIFEAAEGFLTAANAKVLLIGNPTQIGGEYHSAFHTQKSLYNTIHVNVFDTPAFTGEPVPKLLAQVLPSREWQERMRVKYRVPEELERGQTPDGKRARINPVYQVRVLGEFPDQGERVVIPMFEVENATQREVDPEDAEWPRVVSCDVARYGDDETVIAVRTGQRVRIADVRQGQDTMATVGLLLRTARELVDPVRGRPVIVVDDAGVGGGVTDRLREVGEFRVVPYNAANEPADSNAKEYPNVRSESWFEFAEDWLPELDLDDDDELYEELCAPEYSIDSKGRRVVEPKDETKKRLGRSPDKADAVLMAFSRRANTGVSGHVPVPIAKPGGSRWR